MDKQTIEELVNKHIAKYRNFSHATADGGNARRRAEEGGGVMRCETCGEDKDCRPYGNNCAMICFQCAFASPEAKQTTERNYEMQLNAAGPAVLVGLEAGPVRATEKMLNAILKEPRHD